MKISKEERTRREDAINFARGSVRLEGIVLPEEIEQLNTMFVNGEIDDKEHSRLCLECIDSLTG